jgi:hypothetical protein
VGLNLALEWALVIGILGVIVIVALVVGGGGGIRAAMGESEEYGALVMPASPDLVYGAASGGAFNRAEGGGADR